jgi:hypothetical protein
MSRPGRIGRLAREVGRLHAELVRHSGSLDAGPWRLPLPEHEPSIFVGPLGTLWVAGDGGLVKWRPDERSHRSVFLLYGLQRMLRETREQLKQLPTPRGRSLT